ncbi:unnamed protein product [Rotaria magnacalcarata]|uniref:FAD-binding PCMH-type domain-containing protein n=1 Tax=Rotaria magnacalcarata TaxID=392030 RepID=A0A816CUY8_9BILA|nr:unnamed protein product [Rotaria magnacalcarata]CAF1630011.1 unnamed protein product [Rotaria magnacalcarata]CAF1978719.1 unnamed protein product [Rotaria magnacalcarata]CAF1979405.1 unnamed protein product [Rotaria magnacalcarata]CAF2127745.1 unnamed protein product [Rotaria magnacalcarata]
MFLIDDIKSDSFPTLESTIISHGGHVLRVTDSQYRLAATLWNPAIQVWPSLILQPAIYDDVSLALSTLYSAKVPIRIMGGRHSYGGYCSHRGVVLDSSRLKNITINWEDETITMQSGVLWREVYDVLKESEYIIIGGLCPSVGVVGFTLGGGYNSMYTRSYGLALDNVLKFTVALYNGTIVTASSQINPDLYWALRGGGGGNFGYVLEMTQKIHRITDTKLPSGQISFFNITWENQDLKEALLNWLIFLKDIADMDTRISFDVIVYVSSERRFIMMWGTFNGPQVELQPLFNSWLIKNPKPDTFSIFNYTQMDIARELGILINPFPVRERQHIVSAMAINITSTMLDVILESQPNSTVPIAQFMDIIYLNNANKDKNTAWPFPDISFDIAPGFVWTTLDGDYAAINAAESWWQRLLNAAAPTQSIVGAYLNYIDPYMPNWQSMYYRNNWNRLREIKTIWDPTWYFRFPQGIPPITRQSLATKFTSKWSILAITFTITVFSKLSYL